MEVKMKTFLEYRKLIKIGPIGIVGIGMLLGCCGCAPIEYLQQWKTGQLAQIENEAKSETAENTENTGKSSFLQNQLYNENGQPVIPTSSGITSKTGQSGQMIENTEEVEIRLYFTDEKEEALVVEKRTISKVEGIARATMIALTQGPENEKLKATLPTGVTLKDINIKEDGLCIVDFSKELVENHTKTKATEMITVAAIVQTLSQFSSVKEVQILVDGKRISSIGGTVDLSQPIQTEQP